MPAFARDFTSGQLIIASDATADVANLHLVKSYHHIGKLAFEHFSLKVQAVADGRLSKR